MFVWIMWIDRCYHRIDVYKSIDIYKTNKSHVCHKEVDINIPIVKLTCESIRMTKFGEIKVKRE